MAESTLFLSPVETDDLVIIAYEHGDRDIIIPGARFRITDPDGGTIEVTTGPDATERLMGAEFVVTNAAGEYLALKDTAQAEKAAYDAA